MSMRWRWPRQSSSKPSCTRPFAVHPRPDAGLVQQVDADLLEHAGPDAAQHVIAGLALEDHGVDAGPGQKLAEEQARRAGADDCDLGATLRRCPRGHGGSIPWRRFAAAAAGEAMKSSSARAASGWRVRAPTAAEKVVTIWIDAGSGPSTSMPST